MRALFRDTVALGRPLPFGSTGVRRYEALCLDWYLHADRLGDHAVLVGDDRRVHGYALVCVDESAFRAWATVAGARWAATTVGALATRRFGADEARFHRLRLIDGWAAWRSGTAGRRCRPTPM